MTNATREQTSDLDSQPILWYVYILELGDGAFYIGQTNDLDTRLVEHTLDVGAIATKGTVHKLVWFSHTHSREAAQHMEKRLQATLERSPLEIKVIIERFDRLLQMVRPEKTLRQLEAEDRAHEKEMRKVFHHSTALMFNPGGRPPTTCGYDGPEYYSTQEWSVLHQMERERKALESVGGRSHDKQVCQRCLALAPQA